MIMMAQAGRAGIRRVRVERRLQVEEEESSDRRVTRACDSCRTPLAQTFFFFVHAKLAVETR